MTEQPSDPQPIRRLVFRLPRTIVLAAFFIALCFSPAALALPWFAILYLIPAGMVWSVLWEMTTADQEQLIVRSLARRRVMSWTDITSFHLTKRSWVRAVLATGEEIPLPGVRPHHAQLLATVWLSTLPDPASPPSTQE